ncbi:DExH-box ATP-dependent RNA helicase DExH6 [Linum grandiflorum]
MARKKNKNSSSDSVVSESTSIQIGQALRQFQASDNQVFTFEAVLSDKDRAMVHQLSRKMGMTSKSSGHGIDRRVSVYKTPKKGEGKGKNEQLSCFTFSEESQMILHDLFSRYPPEDEELGTRLIQQNRGKAEKQRGRDSMFCLPLLSKEEIRKKLELLSSRVQNDPNFRQTVEARSKLPIAAFSDVIKSTILSNQVVLISGETGCGKTTQVPQFLLDHLWSRGEVCKIICTQPRRISAMSVADRISQERGQITGDDVGYKASIQYSIRLESKGGRHSSIVFCTNGVLLRVLVSSGTSLSSSSSKPDIEELSGITHIIVDEIHERDRYSDFMLTVIRDMLPAYPHLRLILMSATLDAERFAQYFGGCPIIRVPGFTFPVRTFYLEDVLSILTSSNDNHLDSAMLLAPNGCSELLEEDKAALDEAISLAWSNDEFDLLMDLVSSEGNPEIYNYQHSSTGLTPLMVFAGKGRVGDVCMLLSVGANYHLKDKDGMTALALAERENQVETAEVIKGHLRSTSSEPLEQENLLDKYLATVNSDLVDVILIEHLLKKICKDSTEGAIIVFLPGWEDINKTRERLLANSTFADASRFLIISLHSMVPAGEQRKVFFRPPLGCRKIVLSTNIAESAITIDDVVYVIDSGRMKEKSYDPYNNVSTLQTSWISKASARQREGRAGRCQPGICYHLYSRLRAASLPDYQVPEIRRIPIEELCLQVKLLDPNCKIQDFLQKTLDPPISESISNAVGVLEEIGALSADEQLTELGKKLGCLPVHPLISKMLFFAVLMNCLDPALTIACAADYRDPFTLPISPHEKKKATARRHELAEMYGGYSDHLAVVAAYDCWRNAKEGGHAPRFCSDYHVSPGTMQMLHGMRQHLQGELIRNGFLPENVSSCSSNAHDPGIIRAVLVASVYPNVGKFLPPKNGKRGVVQTADGAKVRLHPHSLNFRLATKKSDDCPLVIYDEVTRGDGGMHIRNCTVVGPLSSALLATEIGVAPANDDVYGSDDGETESDEDGMESDEHNSVKVMSAPDNSVIVVLDRWLLLGSSAIDLAQIYCLRERLSAAILFKVTNPRKALPPMLQSSMYAIAAVLSYDELSAIPLPIQMNDMGMGVYHQPAENNRNNNARGRGGTSHNRNGSHRSAMNRSSSDGSRYHYRT